MGLFDFFKKGEEKPAPAQNPNQGTDFFKKDTTAAGATPAGKEDLYTVKSGDSLSKIAKQYYGDAQKWTKIHQANMDQIKDPNLIHPGQQLKIPKE